MTTEPFTRLYRTTARGVEANTAILNELGAYYTSRALTPPKPRVGGLTPRATDTFDPAKASRQERTTTWTP